MSTKASVLREDWATAEQMERAQLQLLNVVDFINKFHASAKTRLAVLSEKMTAIERKLRHVENAVRKARILAATDPAE
ncbi:hypothetical protein F441_09816 [Phytophthora nicotianae CJ01A1]|uniref:Uncharacterized protein n=3 Tax=Phytophthora nicotianae TaxID=4792 RepID=W2Z935_PHYNI|nr:hypothetical protein L916_09570 [Phytophthora nicotianae]ETL92111.1 hypothetical protein L917_09495 [Phytophthora nicotianae]ETM45410.1 hypothetical protein L914_09534 [Phytophthora nicotianae]ETP15421.1 hypothetical protein F441_09816 [Phytophthora nicotianae CJ01A1]ETP43491.1 hypothetical protein F442_09771 [Phytophthora nicotianae P10297]